MKSTAGFCLVAGMTLLISCGQSGKKDSQSATGGDSFPPVNTLSEEEKKNGWILLFDGKTTDGWKNFNQDSLTGWTVEDGALEGLGLGGDIGGDIVTMRDFGNFMLTWEWKLGAHGNSGVMYHVREGSKYKAAYETGPEYQLIEDEDFRDENGNPYPLEEWQKTAADYAMYLPSGDKKVNVRDWNTSKIIFTPEKAEYWLNGVKVLEFIPWSEDWYKRRDSGKWKDYPDYGLAKKGKICLQDHGSKVWFRNIKIRELD